MTKTRFLIYSPEAAASALPLLIIPLLIVGPLLTFYWLLWCAYWPVGIAAIVCRTSFLAPRKVNTHFKKVGVSCAVWLPLVFVLGFIAEQHNAQLSKEQEAEIIQCISKERRNDYLSTDIDLREKCSTQINATTQRYTHGAEAR